MSRFLRAGANYVRYDGKLFELSPDGSQPKYVSDNALYAKDADTDKDINDLDVKIAGGPLSEKDQALVDTVKNFVQQRLTPEQRKQTEAASGSEDEAPATKVKDGRNNWSELFPALSMRNKMRYVGKDGKTVVNALDQEMPSYMGKGPFAAPGEDLGACGIPKSSRTWRLRQQLMQQLKGLAKSEGDEDGGLCFGSCKEDDHLVKMEKTYADHFKGECGLSLFKDDDRLKILEAKKMMLRRQSFAFLHSECEGDDECNPFGKDDIMPEPLLDCCGVLDGALLFGDESMAAVGKFLSGSQKAGESPAALGHASNLYQTGLIAPGVDKNKLWINICYLVGKPMQDLTREQRENSRKRRASTDNAYLDTKWVPANVLEQKKYATLKGIDRAITERKRAILKVNRQILELQMQMVNVQGSDHYFSGDEDSGSDSSFVNTRDGIQRYVQNSVNRAKSALLGAAAKRHMREADQKLSMRVAHGKKGVARETEKALAKLMGGGKKKKKKKTHEKRKHRGRRSSRRR